MPLCPIRRELADTAADILERIIETNKAQIEALRNADFATLIRYDRELENLVGEKERAYGALRQHAQEHGCWRNPIY